MDEMLFNLNENFEIESLKMMYGIKPEISINDLSDEEKSEIFELLC